MSSQEISVTINGSRLKAREGMTILDAATENDIEIPTLCYSSELADPIGACRICVVEVKGSRTLVASCHTPIGPDMVIHTHSPRVLKARRMIVELMLANHTDDCHMCDKANTCELRKIAADLGVAISRFDGQRRFYQIEDVSPWIVRDLSKCVLCLRCVRVCSEVQGGRALSVAYRGFDTKVVSDMDAPLNKEICRDCDACVQICPVGALERKEDRFKVKESAPLLIRG